MTDEQRPYGSGTTDPALRRVRTRHFQRAKEQGIKITGLTSYDFLSASIFDDAGIDFLLVGDSAGNTVFGYDTTIPVTVDELIPLTAAVVRGAKRAFVIADMPFGSYENGPDEALATATRFMKETGAHAVKLEGGVRSAKQIKRIVRAGIPVMAHIGFTPQSEHGLGGHIIQGRGEGAEQLLADAHAVADAGAFAVVLEMVPSGVAAQVTEELAIPTISVGAGPHCDGQLLVWSDWAGFTRGRIPRFVQQYATIGQTLLDAAVAYREDVEAGVYPAPEHEYGESDTRLNVVRTGDGPAIVFLHGLGTSAATWAECMDLLADRFTVAAIDLLGHGGSPVPDDPAEYTRDRALDDIDDVLASLDGAAVLVGHSLGGYLALAHAATRPGVARGIVVLNTGPGYRDPDKREQWNERSRRNAHRFGVPEQVTTLNLQEDSVVMDRLAEITTPTLVLAGSADRPEYTGAGQYLERKMPDAHLVVVDGGEHSMHEHTHAGEVATLIAEFTGRLDG